MDIPNRKKILEITQYNWSYSPQFNFTVTDKYNSINNYLYAQLSGLVYQDENVITAQIKKWSDAVSDPLNVKIVNIEQPLLAEEATDVRLEKTSRFMVVYNKNFIILTFRGSANFGDWWQNFKFFKTKFTEGEGEVHIGFYRTVQNMESEINTTIEAVQTNNQPIYITGHSLGGAQALLSAFVCNSLSDFKQITTFGQPRVGDETFMEWINPQIVESPKEQSRYFRDVNKRDPVANIPYFGYYHVGKFYINCYDGEYYNIVTGSDAERSANLLEHKNEDELVPLQDLYIPFIGNHYIELYIKNASCNKNTSPF